MWTATKIATIWELARISHYIISLTDQLNAPFFYNEFIIHLYMFQAQLFPSSGGQNCVTQHLASSHSAGGRPMHRKSVYLDRFSPQRPPIQNFVRRMFLESYGVTLWKLLCIVISWPCIMWEIFYRSQYKRFIFLYTFLETLLLQQIFNDFQPNYTFRSLPNIQYFCPNVTKTEVCLYISVLLLNFMKNA